MAKNFEQAQASISQNEKQESQVSDEHQPLKPTEQDLDNLFQFYCDEGILDDTPETKEMLKSAYIAKFPKYITDCPGFAGRIFAIIWSGSPNFYDVVTQTADGKMNLAEREMN